MGAKGMVFRLWADEQAPLNSQWLVLRIIGADFLHCWVTDSSSKIGIHLINLI